MDQTLLNVPQVEDDILSDNIPESKDISRQPSEGAFVSDAGAGDESEIEIDEDEQASGVLVQQHFLRDSRD